MKIFHVAAELAPFAKAGGLGDVLQGLTAELQKDESLNVSVFIPKYSFIPGYFLQNLKFCCQFSSFEKGSWENLSLYSIQQNRLTIYLLDVPKYFHRDKIYGYEDDHSRFLYFCRAFVEFLLKTQQRADLIHIHDWHAATIPLFIHQFFPSYERKPKCVFTIHNIEHQGRLAPFHLGDFGINPQDYLSKDRLEDDKVHSQFNLLKGGIVYSDRITTVSPTYAKEIFSPPFSFGIEETLKKHAHKISGILNGLDFDSWNPEKDFQLAWNYGPSWTEDAIAQGKLENKRALFKRFSLEERKVPLFSNIGRLVPQKGISLIEAVIPKILEKGGQFILLGTSFSHEIDHSFRELQKKFAFNPNILFLFEYNEPLARLLYAASDFLVLPSFFEPCGLTQLIGFRYGTIPVARSTGGLADTVLDIDHVGFANGNGYSFQEFSEKAFFHSIERAFGLWSSTPYFQALSKRVMSIDSTWKHPAEKYLALYRSIQ